MNSSPMTCPNCSGTNVKLGKKNEWKNVVTPRVCHSCGHEWEPAPPVWLMVFCMIGGCIGLAITYLRFCFAFQFMPVRIIVFGAMMLLVFGIGLFGLLQRKPKTIVQGRLS